MVYQEHVCIRSSLALISSLSVCDYICFKISLPRTDASFKMYEQFNKLRLEILIYEHIVLTFSAARCVYDCIVGTREKEREKGGGDG